MYIRQYNVPQLGQLVCDFKADYWTCATELFNMLDKSHSRWHTEP